MNGQPRRGCSCVEPIPLSIGVCGWCCGKCDTAAAMNALDVACPFCEVPPQHPCVNGVGDAREETHFTRQLAAANKLMTPVMPQRKLLKQVFG